LSHIKEVFIKNFRLFGERKFLLDPSLNIVHGDNGSGKTSLMEAIFLVNYGKSFKTNKRKELMNGKYFVLKVKIESSNGEEDLSLYFDGEKTERELNGEKAKLLDFVEVLFSLYFNNERIDNFFNVRREGRKILDTFCSGVDGVYLNELLNYNKVLKNKNKLLKYISKRNVNYDVWTEKLSKVGKKIINKRKSLINQMNDKLADKEIKIRILHPYGVNRNDNFKKEMKYKRTLWGPHLDNIKIYSRSKDIRIYGSTGILKTVFFDIISAYLEIYQQKKEEQPFLMIDDFDSDLDNKNIRKYIDKFGSQILMSFITKSFRFKKQVNLLEV